MPRSAPSTHRRAIPRATAVATLALVALAIALRLIPGPHITDDAYITYKYVRNLAGGLGFTYNPGERVLGTTTPLYTMLLAALHLLFRPLGASVIVLSYALNALLDGASVFLLARICRRVTGSPTAALVCGALWAISNVSVSVSISGMETPLYVFLLLATLTLFLRGRTVAAAAACSLAVLTRPDALLLAIPLLGYLLVADRRHLLRALLLGSAVLAPWVVFSAAYFGSPIAASIAAKNIVYIVPAGEALRQFAHHCTTLVGLDLQGPAAYGLSLALGALCVWGMSPALRRHSRALPLLLFPALYVAAFSAANKPMFRWYFVPLEPFYLLGAVAGAHRLACLSARPSRRRTAQLLALGTCCAIVAAQLATLNLLPDAARPWLTPKRVSTTREAAYVQVAEELNRTFPVSPDTTIALPEIGAFGYYSRARILDTAGLVSPEVLRYYPIDPSLTPGNYAIPPDLILDLRPDLLVSLDNFLPRDLLADERFRTTYTEALPARRVEAFGAASTLWVFRRSDWP